MFIAQANIANGGIRETSAVMAIIQGRLFLFKGGSHEGTLICVAHLLGVSSVLKICPEYYDAYTHSTRCIF